MYDLLIRDGNAVLPGTDGTPADIAVSNGKIAGILASGSGAEAREILDARGLVVFPGVIDVHLHLGHGRISRARAYQRMRPPKPRPPPSAASPP